MGFYSNVARHSWDRRSSAVRRVRSERRLGERRVAQVAVAVERRSGMDRRMGERRSGIIRRVLADRRASSASLH